MHNYTGHTTGGRRVILHGRRALQEYLADVERGEAEPLIRVERGIDRTRHRWAYWEGLCYGPCSLERPRRG
ncbi:MAG TPA: hypothetical protein VNI83_04125 [Vicinamibacterales bacterium]|nr:hypothetical protein [Vicinamibacterales bacterium]